MSSEFERILAPAEDLQRARERLHQLLAQVVISEKPQLPNPAPPPNTTPPQSQANAKTRRRRRNRANVQIRKSARIAQMKAAKAAAAGGYESDDDMPDLEPLSGLKPVAFRQLTPFPRPHQAPVTTINVPVSAPEATPAAPAEPTISATVISEPTIEAQVEAAINAPLEAQDVVMSEAPPTQENEPPVSPVTSETSSDAAATSETGSTSAPPSYISDSAIFENQMAKLIRAISSMSTVVHEAGEASKNMSLDAQIEFYALRDTISPLNDRLGRLILNPASAQLDERTKEIATSLKQIQRSIENLAQRKDELANIAKQAETNSHISAILWWMNADLNRLSPDPMRYHIPPPTAMNYSTVNMEIVPRDVLLCSTEFVVEFIHLFSSLTRIPHDAFAPAYGKAYERTNPCLITSLSYVASVWIDMVGDCIEFAHLNYGLDEEGARRIGFAYQLLYNFLIYHTRRLLLNQGNLWDDAKRIETASLGLYATIATLGQHMGLPEWHIGEGDFIVNPTGGASDDWWPRAGLPYSLSGDNASDLQLPVAWHRPSFSSISSGYERFWVKFIVSAWEYIDRSVKGASEQTATRYYNGVSQLPGNWASRLGSPGLVGSTHAYVYFYHWVTSIVDAHLPLMSDSSTDNIKRVDGLFEFLHKLIPVCQTIFLGISQHDHHQLTWAQIQDVTSFKNGLYSSLSDLSDWLPVRSHWIVLPATSRQLPECVTLQWPIVRPSYSRNLDRNGLYESMTSSVAEVNIINTTAATLAPTPSINPAVLELPPNPVADDMGGRVRTVFTEQGESLYSGAPNKSVISLSDSSSGSSLSSLPELVHVNAIRRGANPNLTLPGTIPISQLLHTPESHELDRATMHPAPVLRYLDGTTPNQPSNQPPVVE